MVQAVDTWERRYRGRVVENHRHARTESGKVTISARRLRVARRLPEVFGVGEPANDDAEPLPERPRTRAECHEMARPCPFVSCRFNLFLDVNPCGGGLILNFPDREPGDMAESCALDLAEDGGRSLDEVADVLNFTRERARQIEIGAMKKIARSERGAELVDADETRRPAQKRRLPVFR